MAINNITVTVIYDFLSQQDDSSQTSSVILSKYIQMFSTSVFPPRVTAQRATAVTT